MFCGMAATCHLAYKDKLKFAGIARKRKTNNTQRNLKLMCIIKRWRSTNIQQICSVHGFTLNKQVGCQIEVFAKQQKFLS